MTRFGCARQAQSCNTTQISSTDNIATTLNCRWRRLENVVDRGRGTLSTGVREAGSSKRRSCPTSPKFLDFEQTFMGIGMTSYGGGGWLVRRLNFYSYHISFACVLANWAMTSGTINQRYKYIVPKPIMHLVQVYNSYIFKYFRIIDRTFDQCDSI
jgi:hypothetical protein